MLKKILFVLIIVNSGILTAQNDSLNKTKVEIKFNLVSALALVPNIGIEVELNENFGYQLDTSASFWDSIEGSPFHFVQIFNELRYYPKKFQKNVFLGTHVGYGMFSVRMPSFLTSIIDTQTKPIGSYQSGRNTYYGLTIGKKFKLKNPRLGLEIFIGGGSSQSNYKYYNSDGEIGYDDPIAKRSFSLSGEEFVYRAGLMLVYKL